MSEQMTEEDETPLQVLARMRAELAAANAELAAEKQRQTAVDAAVAARRNVGGGVAPRGDVSVAAESVPSDQRSRMRIDAQVLQTLGKRLGKPVKALLVMSVGHDPNYIVGQHLEAAEWFGEIWRQHSGGRADARAHPRRMHYWCVSFMPKIHTWRGVPYENVAERADDLDVGLRFARWKGLVSFEAIEDHRNPPPTVYLPSWREWHPEVAVVADWRLRRAQEAEVAADTDDDEAEVEDDREVNDNE